jgi:pantoate--beta-alanine ligase
MPEIIRDIRSMQQKADALRRSGTILGLVPTMGALHEGHLSLIRIARARTDIVITTIFVNPTQFGEGEDFAQYPRSLEQDARLAGKAGADIVFAPEAGEMYPEGFQTSVHVENLTKALEGASRPGHFRGVATVVTKLLLITKPHIAVFGQKDAQQVAVIRRLVQDLNIDCEVVVGPIVREADGLAMSSRNAYLGEQERPQATVLYRSLQLADRLIREGEREAGEVIAAMTNLIKAESGGRIDYISIAGAEDLREVTRIERGTPILISLAVRFGQTRLIDNHLVAIA